MSADMPSVSPEEKLLRLIRKKDKSPSPANTAKKITLLPEIRFKKIRLLSIFRDITKVNLLLQGILVCLVAVLLFSFLASPPKIPTGGDARESAVSIPTVAVPPLGNFQQVIGARDIFSVEQQAAQVAVAPSVDINKVKDKLSLLGIISSDGAPQAVIEDKSAQKTFYVRQNETFDEITVLEINESAGKVTLTHSGVEFSIYL